jgi:hypothetical protein
MQPVVPDKTRPWTSKPLCSCCQLPVKGSSRPSSCSTISHAVLQAYRSRVSSVCIYSTYHVGERAKPIPVLPGVVVHAEGCMRAKVGYDISRFVWAKLVSLPYPYEISFRNAA